MIETIHVAILEDVVEITESLIDIVARDPELYLEAHYACAEEAIKDNLPGRKINVFLVDLGLPGVDGISFIIRARELCPTIQYVVHTVSDSSKDLMDALSAGAVGYVLKGSSDEEIRNSLKVVAKGGSLLSPRMAGKLVRFFSEVKMPREVLTAREVDVLKGLKTGMTYAEIAEAFVVSPHTIHTHVKNIYRKLNVGSREEAVRSAQIFDVI